MTARTARSAASSTQTRGNFEAVRANLSEVMLTQGFQDLTGQILRGVQRLIGEVEEALGELTRLTGVATPATPCPCPPRRASEGPAVPRHQRMARSRRRRTWTISSRGWAYEAGRRRRSVPGQGAAAARCEGRDRQWRRHLRRGAGLAAGQ